MVKPSTDSESLQHSIGAAARRAGLQPDRLRAWERRYGAVRPTRNATGRRLYSDSDVRRLQLLRGAVRGGRRIGDVAHLPDADLEELIAGDLAAGATPGGGRPNPGRADAPAPEARSGAGAEHVGPEGKGVRAEAISDACMAAIERLDSRGFERELARASVELSRRHLIDRVLEPLMRAVGERWHAGELRPAHEHMASAGLRSFLGNLYERVQVPEGAPRIVVTTPRCQRHEMGALLVAASASSGGWDVLYLGPDLPAEEIAGAALEVGARAVALSITYPPDDPAIEGELARLGRLLPGHAALLVGGRSAPAYRVAIEAAGGRLVGGLAELWELLAGRREPGQEPAGSERAGTLPSTPRP